MRKNAFTLVETMLCFLLVTLTSACCVGLISVTVNKTYDSTVERQRQKSLSTALLYMSREVRSAKAVDVEEKKLSISLETGENITYEIRPEGLTYNGEVIVKTDVDKSSFQQISPTGVKITLTTEIPNEKPTDTGTVNLTVYRRCS